MHGKTIASWMSSSVLLVGLLCSCGPKAEPPPPPQALRAGDNAGGSTAAQHDDPRDGMLQPVRITSSVPVKVTISGAPRVKKPVYSNRDGEWKALPIEQAGETVTFDQPIDGLPTTLVLLYRPSWLTLPDPDPPRVTRIEVDDKAQALTETVDLGRLREQPRTIAMTVVDDANPLLTDQVEVTVNGKSLDTFGGSLVCKPDKDGRTLALAIELGTLARDEYQVRVTVPDASPARNATHTTFLFSTAPLLRNGDFEQIDDQGQPEHWQCGTWSGNEQTRAELRVVDGGRSGKALMLRGIAGSLNLVCGQPVDVVSGETYVLSGWYRNDRAGGHASIIARKQGKQAQYSNMPALKPSELWAPFRWEFAAEPDNADFMLYLRRSVEGTVYFDDISLEPKRLETPANEAPPPAVPEKRE